MNQITGAVFQLIVLIFSVMVHEVAHGAVAYKLGDTTAKDMGRLNLNPLKHIDMMGSIILPLFLFITRSPILIGWAKPVPYNPFNLKNPKTGAALIGIAGPVTNLLLAIIFGILIRIFGVISNFQNGILIEFFQVIVFINVLLAIFNLVPIPPLDGSKALFAILPNRYFGIQRFLEQYGIFLLIAFIMFGFPFITPIIGLVYGLIVG
ncbi:MAG TPA: site-2 protease family protein [Candidatus Paceibacterota bacterium]